MNETQMPTIENPDAKYRANGGAVTHTKKSLQEKQEERKALHQRKINSKIAKSMKKHHLQERRRASADRARHAREWRAAMPKDLAQVDYVREFIDLLEKNAPTVKRRRGAKA